MKIEIDTDMLPQTLCANHITGAAGVPHLHTEGPYQTLRWCKPAHEEVDWYIDGNVPMYTKDYLNMFKDATFMYIWRKSDGEIINIDPSEVVRVMRNGTAFKLAPNRKNEGE